MDLVSSKQVGKMYTFGSPNDGCTLRNLVMFIPWQCGKPVKKAGINETTWNMRLAKDKISFLKFELLKLSPEGKIYLFGSRVDDEERGGDIDILLLSESKLEKSDFREVRRKYLVRLKQPKNKVADQ